MKFLMSTFKRARLVLLTFIISFAFMVTPAHADAVNHHWSFDSSDVSDTEAYDTPGGNTADLIQSGVENAEFVATGGKFGGYFHEPDDVDQAMLTSPVSFADGDPWTVALWIKWPGLSTPNIMAPIGYNNKINSNEGGNFEQIQLRKNRDKALAWVGTRGNTVKGPSGSGVLLEKVWYHIAVVSDGSSVTLYKNGDVEGSPTVTDNTSWKINSIGRGKRSGGQSNGADLDEVWVFNEALSQSQIDELIFNNSTDVVGINHWSFDESDVSGADAYDVIGGNTATIIQSDYDAEFVSTDGAFGGYFHEPNNLDEATLSSPVSFADGDPWTVALWVNRRGSDFRIDQLNDWEYKNPRIITPIGNNESYDEQIQLRRGYYWLIIPGRDREWVTDRAFAWVGTGGNIVQGPVYSGALPADGWVHIAVVSDGSSVILYRDGVALTPQLYAVTNTGWTFNSIGRGNKKDGENQGADLDEVWVFNEALSEGQINALMNSNSIVVNEAPDVSGAYADNNCLWPPNHKFVDISILGVTDPDGDPVTIEITGITSDEPTATDKGSGGAKHAPDATGVGTDTASVRAERSGDGDGRVYVISFIASDGQGGETEGSVTVGAPHDQSSKKSVVCTAIDSGQLYDATDIN